MKTITISILESIHACQEEVNKFRELFGEEAKVTLANCQIALKNLNVNFFLEKFLSEEEYKLYYKSIAPAIKLYYKSTAPAIKLYNESTAPAYKLYYESLAKILYTTLINAKEKIFL